MLPKHVHMGWKFQRIFKSSMSFSLKHFFIPVTFSTQIASAPLKNIFSLLTLGLVWLNGRVFVYELGGCGFESCCSLLDLCWIFPDLQFQNYYLFTIISMMKWTVTVKQFKKSVIGLCSNIFCHRFFIIK